MIELRNVYKFYQGKPAVSNLTLTIERGDIFGFIGPNGAGKTTTIRMVATLLAPDAGIVTVNGQSVRTNPAEVRRIMGYMPDEYGLYDEMDVEEYLLYCASLMKVDRAKRQARVDQLLELLNLGEKRHTDLYGLSKGMRNRVFLAKALIHDPLVLILDEPASGLDPRARIEFRETLKQLAAMGKTIFISSHILTEMDQFCNRVGIIEAGRLVVADTVANLQKRKEPPAPGGSILDDVAHRPQVSILEIRILPSGGGRAPEAPPAPAGAGAGTPDDDRLLELLKARDIVRSITKAGDLFRLEFDGDDAARADLLRDIVTAGMRVAEFAEKKLNLEDIFMKTTTGRVN